MDDFALNNSLGIRYMCAAPSFILVLYDVGKLNDYHIVCSKCCELILTNLGTINLKKL